MVVLWDPVLAMGSVLTTVSNATVPNLMNLHALEA